MRSGLSVPKGANWDWVCESASVPDYEQFERISSRQRPRRLQTGCVVGQGRVKGTILKWVQL